jgi:hypothetical protein
LSGDQLTLRVLYEGKPDAGREVIVLDPSGKQIELKTDEEGRASTAVTPGGSYAVRAAHVEADRGGERNGKAFSQTWHYCTLTLSVPKQPALSAPRADELSAADLLARARAARSVWKAFPGFSADISVHMNGRQSAGKLTIEPQGTVSVEIGDSMLRQWTEEQLNSLVQHRMPDDSISQGKVKYADGDLGHPLGRKIDLGDPDLGSVYRIKDDVITEVNRKLGKMRFTISVLEVTRDSDDKYFATVVRDELLRRRHGRTQEQSSLLERLGARRQIRHAESDHRGGHARRSGGDAPDRIQQLEPAGKEVNGTQVGDSFPTSAGELNRKQERF